MKYESKFQTDKMLLVIAIITVIVLALICVFTLIVPAVNEVGTITPPPEKTFEPLDEDFIMTDEVLERAIQKQLGISRRVTKSDVELLTVLNYEEEAVKNLTGLKFAVNLKELRLKIDVDNVDELAKLGIKKLTLISDSSLQYMTQKIAEMEYVQYLNLTSCGITNVAYLTAMKSLDTLILDDNKICDGKYLDSIPLLTTVSMKNCGIKNISFLKSNMNIKKIYLDNNKIEDISPLSEMFSLEEATYEGNPIKEDKEEK